MSVFSGIEDWVISRLDTQVAAFRSVTAIANPEEFRVVGTNPPAAAVLIISGSATGDVIQDGTQLITTDIGIWFSSLAIRGGAALDDTSGAHELFDSIWAAFKNQTPTGAHGPLRYISHDLENIENGLAIMQAVYQTIIVI